MFSRAMGLYLSAKLDISDGRKLELDWGEWFETELAKKMDDGVMINISSFTCYACCLWTPKTSGLTNYCGMLIIHQTLYSVGIRCGISSWIDCATT